MCRHTSTVHIQLIRLFTMLPVAVLLMLVMAMLLGGCRKHIVEPPSEIDITGVVVERSGVSVVPIAGVLVSLGTRVDTSDSQGRFGFGQVSAGNVAVSFAHAAYSRLDTLFSINGNTSVRVYLTRAATKTYWVGGLLSYRNSNQPLTGNDGVTVQLDDTTPQAAGYYDGTCSYSFTVILAGPHRFRIAGPMVLPIDTVVTVDHDCICGTSSSLNYNFQLTLGLSPGREFLLPQTVGTMWRYQYSESSSYAPVGAYTNASGTHVWQIASVTPGGSGLVLQIANMRIDTVHSHTVLLDTTYASSDTVSFQMVIGTDSLTIGCPEMISGYRMLPRYCLQSSDTVQLKLPDVYSPSHATYVNRVGVVDYSWSSGGNSHSGQALKFLGFVLR